MVLAVIYGMVWIATLYIPSPQIILAPICNAPLMTHIIPLCKHIPSSPPSHSPITEDARYSQLADLQLRLSNIIELTQPGDTSLSQSISRSSIALRDLTTQVRVSGLKSKDILVGRLEAFLDQGNDATRGLARLTARVGGSIDT